MNRLLLSIFFLLASTILMAQERTVTGTIKSASDQSPLPGVSIIIKGTTLGTISDIDGNYTINVPSSESIIVYTFVGMSTTEELVGGRSIIDIALNEDVTKLSEIVITGYGQQKRSDLTGAISSVSSEMIENMPTPSFEGALQGQAAGINITTSSGNPGAAMRVSIRGANSITASSEPLYVIDGIPMVSEDNSVLFTGGYNANSLADLNPDDIASIEVLKDASATAIYGSRASNGVILVTTKRGKTGKPKINFNYYTGVQQATRVIDMLEAPDFVRMLDEAAANDGFGEGYFSSDPNFFNFIGDPNDPDLQNTNWYDEIYRNGRISNYSLSATGGNENVKYYVGGSYFDNEGYQLGSSFERFSGRVNLDIKATEKLDFGTSISLSQTDQQRPIGDNSLYGVAINSLAGDPTMPVFEADGSYADPFAYWSWWAFENPRASTDIYQRRTDTKRALASVFAEYEIIEGLKFKSSWSADVSLLDDNSFIPSVAAQSRRAGTNGEGFYATFNQLTWLNENSLTYTKNFGDHDLTALAVYSLQESQSEFSDIAGQGYALDDLPNLELASENTAFGQDGTSWGIRSFVGRINYKFKDKYLLTLSGRLDGSSRFGSENQNAFFPSASVAWRISEEDFLSNSNLIDDLKLRVSYGITGNQEGISNFASRALWSTSEPYQGIGGTGPSRLGNGTLGWEETSQFDIGIDLSLFGGRLNVVMDYYDKRTSDLLLNAPVPAFAGVTLSTAGAITGEATQNLGEISNRGLEFSLNTVNIDRGGFKWETNFNIALNRNNIETLVNDSTRIGDEYVLMEGQVLGTYFMPRFTGVDPQTGNATFVDVNGDGAITPDDAQVVGNIQPDFFGGISNTFSYKGFDLRAFFSFSVGQEVWNRSRHAYQNMGLVKNFGGFFQPYGNISQEAYDNRWQNPGDNTYVPRLSLGFTPEEDGSLTRLPLTAEDNQGTSQFIEDGTFIRLQNLTLGYTLPSKLLSKTKVVNSVRFYAQGQNLLLITDYLGQDPEVSSNGEDVRQPGMDFGALGPPRTITIGVNIGL